METLDIGLDDREAEHTENILAQPAVIEADSLPPDV
jgi:hypothetical protein